MQRLIHNQSCDAEEIIVPRNTRMDIVLLADDETTPMIMRNCRIILEDRATALVFSGIFSSTTIQLHGILRGDHAIFEHHIAYMGSAHYILDMQVSAEHRGTSGMSRIMTRGVAYDASHARVMGSIHIQKHGKGADARWEHEGLLLSPHARIDALPGLAIETDDVRASHSSAIHYVRPDQLFYAQTRGIDIATARRMIVQGFLSEMLTFVHDPLMHQTIYDMIIQKSEHLAP